MNTEITRRCTGPCGFLQQENLRDYVCIGDGHCDIHRSIFMRRLDASRNLEAIVREDSPLRLGDMYVIICQIAGRLDALHKANICHGDAKAKNMILTKYGPILIDFGQSKILTDANRTELIHADCRQLMWIVFQLRFHLPFKHEGERQGLMDPDSWDLFGGLYTLCGSVFDEVASNREFTIANVLAVAHDLFGPNDLSGMCVYTHCSHVWNQIFTLLVQFQKDHKNLKKSVNELPMSPEVRMNLKTAIKSLFNDHRIGLRQLLSIERDEGVINRAQSLREHFENKHNEIQGAMNEASRNL